MKKERWVVASPWRTKEKNREGVREGGRTLDRPRRQSKGRKNSPLTLGVKRGSQGKVKSPCIDFKRKVTNGIERGKPPGTQGQGKGTGVVCPKKGPNGSKDGRDRFLPPDNR